MLASEPEAALRALGYEAPEKAPAKPKRKRTVMRTPVAAPPLDSTQVSHVSADDARGFAGEGGPPPGANYDQHLGYLGGQEG